MKKSDIKIGAEYACSAYQDYDSRGGTEHVKVVGEAVSIKENYYPYKARVYVPVHVFKDGAWDAHEGQKRQTRHIREDWAPYAERQRERRTARLEQKRRTAAMRRARAESLPELLDALEAAGVEPTGATVYDGAEVLPLLQEFIPERLTGPLDGDAFARITLSAPLAASVAEYVKSGSSFQISAADLTMLANLR